MSLSLGVYRQFASVRNVRPDEHNAPSVVVATLDFSKEFPETRRASEAPPEIQKIPANSEELLITLPGGSPTGEYEVQIRPEGDLEKPAKAFSGSASTQLDGSIMLRVALDGPLHGGTYAANWRGEGEQFWHSAAFTSIP